MIVKSKLLLGVFLAAVATQTFAENLPVNAPKLPEDPTTYCPNTGNISCLFTGLLPYGGDPNKDGAYFHCTPNLNTQKTFNAVDVASLISGFTKDGSLTGSTSDLTKYSFAAYADPSHPNDVGRTRFLDQNNNYIPCESGTGGLPVHPGDPGSAQN